MKQTASENVERSGAGKSANGEGADKPPMWIKDGAQTSSFKLAAFAAAITPFIPLLMSGLESLGAKLPDGSWLAILIPGIVAIGNGIYRAMTTNNARDNEARVRVAELALESKTIEAKAQQSVTLETKPLDAAALEAPLMMQGFLGDAFSKAFKEHGPQLIEGLLSKHTSKLPGGIGGTIGGLVAGEIAGRVFGDDDDDEEADDIEETLASDYMDEWKAGNKKECDAIALKVLALPDDMRQRVRKDISDRIKNQQAKIRAKEQKRAAKAARSDMPREGASAYSQSSAPIFEMPTGPALDSSVPTSSADVATAHTVLQFPGTPDADLDIPAEDENLPGFIDPAKADTQQ